MPEFDDPVVQRIYEAGAARIARLRAAFLAECPDEVVRLPFVCCNCEDRRYDFCLMTGDKLPMCQRCFDGMVAAIGGADAKQA